jgi:hypothetical protein
VISPIVKHCSIRALLGIVAMHDLELEQLDVRTAFLHGDLEERFIWISLRVSLCLVRRILYAN